MRKIIGFDSWTGGAINWTRIASACEEQGVEFFVVHLGSWGGDPGRPRCEKAGKVDFRDIAYYGNSAFDQILKHERPEAVIFLSTDTFSHRAFNRYCRQLSIPTAHLYHGLVSVQEVTQGRAYKVDPIAQLRFILERIPKAVRYVWPAYMKSLLKTNGRLIDWARLVKDIVKGALGYQPFRSAEDARTDICFVYTHADADHAITKYGFERGDVIEVGNPDLARFGVVEADLGYCLTRPLEAYSDVMYIDTGLVFTGCVFSSRQDFVDHLVTTKAALLDVGRNLIFKPHPDHLRTDLPAQLAEAGIRVIRNEDLVQLLRRCCACIVEPSTLSLVPALMGLPLLLARYGRLNGQRYGQALMSYPRALELDDLSRLEQLLSVVSDDRISATRAWVAANAGPLPASQMPLRVMAAVEEMIRG